MCVCVCVYINLCKLSKAKDILAEEQMWYYLTLS